ncbi:deoxynucleoside kinase [Enterococcus timonensis]|uniref:deoxynucleoside kinase n=1 Tax=Enterococcus timonensis TaxID=1852364 RepID=UPI0008D98924|nr:deoxynucleoside kinase [Enterococcus timonensis]
MLLVAGTIGSGKTSLTHLLAQEFSGKTFVETVDDNLVLPLFYKDPKTYAYPSQIFFLNKRFIAMKQALVKNDSVLDRSIYEDSLIFHLNADLGRIDASQVAQYDLLLNTMLSELEHLAAGENSEKQSPDLLIFIEVSLETMLSRIKERGNPYEQVDVHAGLKNYYAELTRRYQIWFEQFHLTPKMKIDGNRYDFVNNPEHRLMVLNQIKAQQLNLAEQSSSTKKYQPQTLLEKGIF